MIVDAERGLVLTNNHVIENADGVSVTLADGRTFEAELVGADPDTDVAVIRIPAENLSALNLADSAQLRVGDFVVAVGNPFGLGQTVTSGIVSAVGRSGLQGLGYQNFIQTDASINPGNSGGALVNLRGELVGINTASFNPRGSAAGNIGLGFAIPANLAREVAAAGVKTVGGDVRIDDRLFDEVAGTGSGPRRVTPIVVNDNLVDVVVTPGERPGDPASVKIVPETAFVYAAMIRWIGVAVLVGFVVRDILQPERDVVRRTYGDDPDGGDFVGVHDHGLTVVTPPWLSGLLRTR